MNFEKEFEEKGMENIKRMEEVGFLKRQGYTKNSGWKVMAVILGFLFVGVIGFGVYQISKGKFQFNANPNILCESQVCELTCPECPSNNITCLPPQINLTINNLV